MKLDHTNGRSVADAHSLLGTTARPGSAASRGGRQASAPLVLVSHALCPYAQRAAIVLAEKAVAFERRDVDLADKPDWFLRISPLGKTPVLLVGDEATYLGGRLLDEIDRTLIDRIKFDRQKIASAGTANRYLALIRSILKRACGEWEWIGRVPKFNLFREKDGRVRSLSPPDFQRLLSELPNHLADMAIFSVTTGLRAANVKGLEWSYVDLQRRHVRIPDEKHKNGRPHSVPLNDMAMAVVLRQVGKHPQFVFTYRGEPVGQLSTRAWQAALGRAGIEDFR